MIVAEYQCNGGTTFVYTEDMKKDFEEYGYFIVRGLLDDEEMSRIRKTIDMSEILTHSYGVPDDEGRESKLVIWSHPGNDVTGMLARCEKVAGTCEKILGGEVYFYHAKLMLKEPFTAGRHVWHQDYGYWYNNGCLFPDLMTVYIALDKCEKTNGCLQVLRGSHKCGRVNHNFVGGQHGADMERIGHLMKCLDHVYVEMEPGDALYFHSNLVHMADQNRSEKRRWTLLYSYNTRANNPVYEHHHPRYTPMEKVPDAAIATNENYTDMSGKDFLDPSIDKTVKAKK